MRWESTEIVLLNTVGSLTHFAANWLLQSSLLIMVGISIAWLLRHRGSAFQSAVYRTTLVAVLLGPMVSLAMNYHGLKGWAVILPRAFALTQENDKVVSTNSRNVKSQFGPSHPDSSLGTELNTDSLVPGDYSNDESKTSFAVAANDLENSLENGGRESNAPRISQSEATFIKLEWFGLFAICLSLLWIAVAVLRTVRLVAAMLRMNRLRHDSLAASQRDVEICRQIAKMLGVAAPQVLRSPFLTSPCLHGIRRPAVLLPEDVAVPLQNVFVHELAHLRRHDCFWLLVRQIASALFFFQPMLYWLGRRMDTAAEEVCDDFVVQFGGDRASYATCLLDIAVLSTPPLAFAGVGMVTLRSLLGKRVTRILDTSRSLSTRVEGLSLALVICGGFSAILIGGFIGVSSNSLVTAQDPPVSKSTLALATPTTPIKLPSFSGLIQDSEHKPVAGARVALVGWPVNSQDPKGEIVAEVKTGSDGAFSIDLKGASSKTHGQPALIAHKDGLGLAWQKVDLDFPGQIEPMQLFQEGIITARMVDSQGKPLAGLKLQPTFVVVPKEKTSSQNLGNFGSDKSLATTTDAEGRFSIRGISVRHGVYVSVEGNDQIAPQSVALNTGGSEQRGERDATYRAIVRNLKPDEDAAIELAPAQIFEGTVRYADSKEPVPNTRVVIWSSQQVFGSMTRTNGQTDSNGRYRVSAQPGIRFGIQVHAPSGSPYLNRNTPHDKSIEWKEGDRTREIDFELPRGVLVRGAITEKDTKVPVADAYVQYVPESANNKNATDDILNGWQATQRSDKDGKFEIVVLPGPGSLLISTPGENHILKPIGNRTIDAGKEGGIRHYVHAYERIAPSENAEPLDLQISVERGKRISGTIVNDQEIAPKETTVVSITNISPFSLFWRGQSKTAIQGKFELGGLADGVEYKTHFLDAENQLGATAILTSASESPTIKLEPCGTATARFVDKDGKPASRLGGGALFIVLTPGLNPYTDKAMQSGPWYDDSDLVVNVDRKNQLDNDTTDPNGRITYKALIPGATYELRIGNAGQPIVKSFVAKSGESIDLGEFSIHTKQ